MWVTAANVLSTIQQYVSKNFIFKTTSTLSIETSQFIIVVSYNNKSMALTWKNLIFIPKNYNISSSFRTSSGIYNFICEQVKI